MLLPFAQNSRFNANQRDISAQVYPIGICIIAPHQCWIITANEKLLKTVYCFLHIILFQNFYCESHDRSQSQVFKPQSQAKRNNLLSIITNN